MFSKLEEFNDAVSDRYRFDIKTTENGNAISTLLDNEDQMLELYFLYGIARRIFKESFFEIKQSGKVTEVVGTCLYWECFRYLNFDVHQLRKFFKNQKFNPYVELVINNVIACRNGVFGGRFPSSLDFRMSDNAGKLRIANAVKEIEEKIRAEAHVPEFKKSISGLRDGVNKNARGLNKYIDTLFEIYSKLLVVRLDLGYRREHAYNVTYNSIKRHVDQFLKNRGRVQLFKSMVGYALKIEEGIEKGLHVHMILFFNGSEVRKDEWYADQVGNYWIGNITKGMGVYFNCHRFKSRYRGCGIGMIVHSDSTMRNHLKNAANYLTKVDYWIRLDIPEVGRTFRRGEIPKLRISEAGKLPGRPRAKQQIT